MLQPRHHYPTRSGLSANFWSVTGELPNYGQATYTSTRPRDKIVTIIAEAATEPCCWAMELSAPGTWRASMPSSKENGRLCLVVPTVSSSSQPIPQRSRKDLNFEWTKKKKYSMTIITMTTTKAGDEPTQLRWILVAYGAAFSKWDT